MTELEAQRWGHCAACAAAHVHVRAGKLSHQHPLISSYKAT